jgi:hypothetical protein
VVQPMPVDLMRKDNFRRYYAVLVVFRLLTALRVGSCMSSRDAWCSVLQPLAFAVSAR